MKELKCDLNSAAVANCATELHPARAAREEKRERETELCTCSLGERAGKRNGGNGREAATWN